MIKFPYNHFNLACWTVKRIHPKSMNDRNETVMYNIGISKVIFGMFRNFVFSFSFPADIVKDELEYLVNSGRKF